MQTLQGNFSNKKILITGPPGCGKTTLIKEIYNRLKPLNPAGFFTEEIREKGNRKGFRIKTFDGKEGILAHINIKSNYKVSKYGVDVEGFEKILKGIDFFSHDHKLVIIDEIGKMECFSGYFRDIVLKLFDSNKTVIATIAIKGNKFIEQIKSIENEELYTLSAKNHSQIIEEIMELLEIDYPFIN